MEKVITRQSGIEEQITDIVGPMIASQHCELIRTKVSGLKDHAKVAIFVDTQSGEPIKMEQLESINRLLSDAMDVFDAEHHWFAGPYEFEVSSPGLDRPLTKLSHFQKVLGNQVRLKIDSTCSKPKTISGILKSVDENQICLEGVDSIAWSAIRDATLVHIFPPKNTGKKRRA